MDMALKLFDVPDSTLASLEDTVTCVEGDDREGLERPGPLFLQADRRRGGCAAAVIL